MTATGAVSANSPWFRELQVRLGNTTPITSLTVTVNVARTGGAANPQQYNTVGGQITQSLPASALRIPSSTRWTLNSGQTLGISTNRTFAAQFGGNGTAHPVTGDTWSMVFTTTGNSTPQTLSDGTFPS